MCQSHILSYLISTRLWLMSGYVSVKRMLSDCTGRTLSRCSLRRYPLHIPVIAVK